MTCKRARQYLQLSRPGELGSCERRRLAAHVHRCSACAAEEKANRQTDAWIAGAREFSPHPEDASSLTAVVMDAVRDLDSKRSGQKRTPAAARLFPHAWQGFPALSKILAGGVMVLLAVLAAQTWIVLRKVSSLQEAMALSGERALASREEISPPILVRRAVAGLEAPGETDRSGREWLVLEKATLDDLFALARHLSAEDFIRFERILSRIPYKPWGTSPGPLSEEDRMFLLEKRNELRIWLRGR
jgi:anti-sigma factor RsiW